MRILTSVLVLLVLGAACLAQDTFLSYPRYEYGIPQAQVVPTIDGAVSEAEWKDALPYAMVVPDMMMLPLQGNNIVTYPGPESPEDLSAYWYLKWDATNLYLAVVVRDDDTAFSQGADMAADNLRMYVNLGDMDGPQGDHVHLDISASTPNNGGGPGIRRLCPGDSCSAGWLGGAAIAATVQQDKGYVLELALPWEDVVNTDDYVTAQVGDVHGIGLMAVDYAAVGTQTAWLSDFARGLNTGNLPYNKVTLVEGLPEDCGVWGYDSGDVDMDCDVDIADFAAMTATWDKCSDPNAPECEPAM